MPNGLERRPTDVRLIEHLTGLGKSPDNPAPSPLEIETVMRNISPFLLSRERAIAQAAELIVIGQDADRIFKLLKAKDLPHPSAYAVFTAGYNPPEGSIELGTFGEKDLESFPPPEIAGHAGKLVAIPLHNGEIMLTMTGRAHPNEWVGERFAPMIVAHPLRVVKEMIRRQRTKDADPPVFLTYLAGVIEGYQMKPGDAGVIVSDSEGTNVLHPGFGPTAILDNYLGSHFQPKFASTSSIEETRILVQTAIQMGLPIYPVSVCGAAGTPEFENAEEIAAWIQSFKVARKGASGDWAGIIFDGKNPIGKIVPILSHGRRILTPAFGMGITFEQAVMRQRHPNENPFKVVAMIHATDTVGESGSKIVSHAANVAAAFATGGKYRDAIIQAANMMPFKCTPKDDYSLQNLIYNQ
jgi:hypothetical protein